MSIRTVLYEALDPLNKIANRIVKKLNYIESSLILKSKNIDDSEIIVQGLADAFNAPKTAVRIRLREVLYV